MSETLRPSRRLLAVGALATTLLGCGLAPADAVTVTPNRVAPLQEFTDYWKPVLYNTLTDETKDATLWRGTVTDKGAPILRQNDKTLVEINHVAAADTTQAHRALVDADEDWRQTLPDALGPELGTWFDQGLKDGSLPLSSAAFEATHKATTTGDAKPYFNYPRPFVEDRSVGGKNNLNGVDKYSGITRIPDWTDTATGKTHTAAYDGMLKTRSQAFPSGHTTFAYQEGIQLAMLVPELGPEALVRSSEAGNNRIALGVHYPMDVMGGRILGHLNATAQYADEDYVKNVVEPAHKELSKYLADQCKSHGHSGDLKTCIGETGANDAKGYQNAFTDTVSKAPVTDRASALKAYESRMTYNFQKVGPSGLAPRVPVGAERLLTTAFPSLDTVQRRAVLAATEIDSGYIFDRDSDGWQRIDLPAAMSAKVTLDQSGKVVKVEPGQKAASVVKQADQKPAPTTEPTAPAPSASATQPAVQPAPGTNGQPTTPAATAPSTTTPIAGQPTSSASAASTAPAAPAKGSNGNGSNGSGTQGSAGQGSAAQPAAQPVSGNNAPAAPAVAPATAPAEAGGTTSTTDSGLARTGADAVGYVVGGIAFLALGTAAVVWGLRRREVRN